MNKVIYEIREYSAQLTIRSLKDLSQLRPACTSDDTDPVMIASYDDEAAARKHLERLTASVDIKDAWASGKVAMVTEYALECNDVDVDEDGDVEYIGTEWIDFTDFPTEICCGGTTYEYNYLTGWMPTEDEEDAE